MKTISEMFNNTYFRIPDYQRGYAWTDKQLSEFWDDIEDLAENQPHYTGTIFVEEMKEVAPQDRWLFNAGNRFYSVVDGQQRLTTVSILLYELLKKESTEYNEVPVEKLIDQYIFTSNATGNSRVYHFSYLNNEQNDCLLHDIFEDKQIIFKSSSLTAYDQNLLNAKNFFAEKISCLYKSQRDILFKKVSTALKFDFKVIDDCLDVQAVFETMNNRGKPLTILEKLKNRLIYMSENYVVENLIGGNNFFEIPEYQRAYSWEEAQWAQFIDDLKNVQEKYYLGHFLFEEGADRLLVIDGQQRLTTCMIFFRAVINCLEKRGVENKIKLFKLYLFDAVREKARLKTVAYDNNFFYDLIVKNSAAKTADTKSQHNIKNALEYFEKELDKIISEEILQMAELLAHATVTYYKVNDKAMAAQIFAFQNDRGKDLSELEKIKSYLFLQVYLNSSGGKQKEAIEYIDRDFGKIYEGITRIKLHEDAVVNYYWRSRSNKGLYSDKTLSEIKEVLAATPDKLEWIRNFTSQLADAFAFVAKFEKYDEDQYAVRLKQLDNMALVYPFLFKANRFGVYDSWNKTFKRLLRFLENIIFRALLRGGRAELTSRLNWLLAFTSASDLDEKISQAVAWLKDDNSYWGYWGNGEMCRILNGYFYGNRVDNYFYWQYEMYRNRKNGYDAPSGIKYSDIVRSENIEHIAPRTPTNGDPLANGYGIYVDAVAPENGIESGQWLNCIGNLMLIAESHNKSIGNCRFADKLTSYEKSSLSQQREIKDFATNKDDMLTWDMEAIKKRKQSMIEAAMEIWSLDNI